ncbi:MAG: type III-B CRISPR module RAMP protein Cmr1 [Thermosediminibacteraceae bacterium]|nr:type III-B CRISPR module RAMP protein Cmr1 [Thermosediminibacteraceae bacterium]
MYQVEFELKVVTPLYMFGAYQDRPEIRASEFKGMLRFWWRALKGNDNIAELKREEEEIFGGTSSETGKSKVSIRVIKGDVERYIGNNLKRDYQLGSRDRGILYLLYSMLRRRGGEERKYFKPPGKFKVILFAQKDEIALKNAVAAFWCAVNLGNFGARSRRGAGSLVVSGVRGSTYGLDFIPKGKSSEELSKWILENLKKAAGIVNTAGGGCKSYSSLVNSSLIVTKESYECWWKALGALGSVYMDFRKSSENRMQRAAFGLPVVFMNKDKIIGIDIDKGKDEGKINRRSSPLLFKIIESEGRYYWLVLRFGGKFLPEGVKLAMVSGQESAKGQGEKLITEEPSFELLDAFWNKLTKDNNNEYHIDLVQG